MNTSDKYLKIAREFADLMRAQSGRINEIILFGSIIRNQAVEASDIDVAVVVDRKDRAIREIECEAGEQIMNKHGALVGCLVYSADEWEKSRRFPFGSQIAKQGIRL